MASIDVSPDNDRIRSLFFHRLFGELTGFVAVMKLSQDKKASEEFFPWPSGEPQLHAWINKNYIGNNLYFSCQLWKSSKHNGKSGRVKENVKWAPCVWADIDAAPLDKLEPEPTITVETSPGRHQGYWVFPEVLDPSDAEDFSRRYAYKYKEIGVDVSGWDLTQLLRIPQTYNYKYKSGSIPIVNIVGWHKQEEPSDPELFKLIDQVPGFEYLDIPFEQSALPTASAEDILDKFRAKLPPRVFELVQIPPEKDWSTALWSLECLLLESGLTPEETFVVAEEAACNKYRRDGRSSRYLWKDVQRAFNTISSRVAPTKIAQEELLTADERGVVKSYPPTFADRYIAWASGLGDAATEYHEAGAFVCLSGLLAGSLRLPTSYGTIIPNLWFMLLADTTLTRKTTSMDLAMDLLMEVSPDCVLATDGSLEGLMTTLATRPGKSSIFWRDELTGLIELMAKRDYYAGMLEGFTKLYDGKYQKRILRKEVIEIRDPCLIVFAGGVKTKMMTLLTDEHISTGFLPRFLFFTAEADVNKLKPIGPATLMVDDNRKHILAEMVEISDRYSKTQTMKIGDQVLESRELYFASLTPAAWERYNELEASLLREGTRSDQPDLFTPTLDRLAKSTLKVAILLAASRQEPAGDGKFIVGVEDILKAVSYAETWRMSLLEVISNIGKTGSEHVLEKVHAFILKNVGITRSRVMQQFHFTARDIEWVVDTLEQRGYISRQKAGRTEKYFPIALEAAAHA